MKTDELEAGPKLDAFLTKKVMGWEWMGASWRPPGAPLGQYRSFNPTAAMWDAWELLETTPWEWRVDKETIDGKIYWTVVAQNREKLERVNYAKSLPLAICQVAHAMVFEIGASVK